MEALSSVIRSIANRPLEESQVSQLALCVVGQCMIYRFAPRACEMTLGKIFLSQAGTQMTDARFQEIQDDELETLADLISQFSVAGILRAASPDQ